MLASDSICLDKFKDIFHVFIAVPSPFAGLTTFKEKAPDSLIEYWQIRDSSHPTGNLLTLVIATLAKTLLANGSCLYRLALCGYWQPNGR